MRQGDVRASKEYKDKSEHSNFHEERDHEPELYVNAVMCDIN